MTLLALIIALLVEQVRPLPVQRVVIGPLTRFSSFLRERYDDGSETTARALWIALILVVCVAAGALHSALWEIQPMLALLFNVGLLYLTMGFRQESHFFSDIHLALRMGEIDRARALVSEWTGRSHPDASESEVARLAIERALVAAHRNVFGVSFWFVLLPGPSGAVLYRLARFFAAEWARGGVPARPGFGRMAARALAILDWLPARLTALGFSVAGNFEDAVLCWRTQARQWHDATEGILISSGAGAMGVRLGLPVHDNGADGDRPEMGTGDEASADFMQSTIGLVWRTLVLCLLLLALIGIAGWVGG